MSRTQSKYIPETEFDVGNGFTQAEFEGPGIVKACPIEEGLMYDGDAINKSIVFANLSGRDLAFSVSHVELINPNEPAQRWNQNEIDGFPLYSGQGTHLPIDASFYTLSVGEYVVGETGKRFRTTYLGKRYNTLVNKSISLFDGDCSGDVEIRESKCEEANHTQVINHTTLTLRIVISRETLAYTRTAQQIALIKASRDPDFGAKILVDEMVPPNSTWWYKMPRREFTIRAIDPECHMNHRGNTLSCVVPNMRNYVEMASATASAAQVVVALKGLNEDGEVVLVVYPYNSIKPVLSDICSTKKNRI